MSLTRYGSCVVVWVIVLSFQASFFESLVRFMLIFTSLTVRLPHFRPQPAPGSPHLPAHRPRVLPWPPHLHPHVRCHILPRHLPLYRRRSPWQSFRQLRHGQLRSQRCQLLQCLVQRRWRSHLRSSPFNCPNGPRKVRVLSPIQKTCVLTVPAPRFLVGVAAGIGICVGPIYLSEIAPPKIKGSLGNSPLFMPSPMLHHSL